MNEIWVEKFRPKKFDEFVGHEDIVKEIKGCLKEGEMPHLLFHGPAGTGKTTMAYLIGRNLFGDNFKTNFLELNASDERGIQVIREKVKTFAKTNPLGADFKIVFLDEADYLTSDAQASLRRVMELYTTTTRFILSCNYVNKIIYPLQSRCRMHRFKKLREGDILGLLGKINTKLSSEIMEEVAKNCKGDLRMAINEIQTLSTIEGVTLDKIKKTESDLIPYIIKAIKNKNFIGARTLIDAMITNGWNERRILIDLRDEIVKTKDLKPSSLLQIMKADERIVMGVDVCLVFDGLVLSIM